MKKLLPFLILGVSFAACGEEPTTDPAEEAAANEVTGKSDALFEQIVFGTFENANAGAGEFSSLTLTDVPRGELPGAHYEGTYELVEVLGGGEQRTSKGAFNVYRYNGFDWIRFLDEDGTYKTSAEKYSWFIDAGAMVLNSGKGSFALDLVGGTSVSYSCSYGVEDSEWLQFDVTDPYESTPALLIDRVTVDSGEPYARAVAGYAAQAEGVSLDEYLAAFDEGEVEVYDLTWFSSAFEMVRGYRGDTEVGVIFDQGFDEPIAQISDGEIMGCRSGECSYDIGTIFPDSTTAFHGDPLAAEIGFIENAADMTPLMVEQLRAALTVSSSWDDYTDATADQLLENTDDGGFWYYQVDNTMHWLKWYGGDNEVGAFLELDTTNVVGIVGDGEISSCVPE